MEKEAIEQGRRDERPREPDKQPMFNAPLIVIGMALALVGLHGATYLLDDRQWVQMTFDYALVPRRFFAEAGSDVAYTGLGGKLLTLVSSGFLHGGWMHVIVNSGMLLAFGTPVARTLGGDPAGLGKRLLIYFGAVAVGSIVYLALQGADGGAAVGASGGVSGLMAAAMLIGPDGTVRSPLSRGFITFTAIFAVANVLLALAGPWVLGAGVAWEAHAGGYLAGAIIMLLLGPRLPRYGGMDRGFENL